MTNLYLIRHGEAVGNVRPILAGLRDPGLTPFGVSQAERLRDRLAATQEIAADVLIASTMPRARQTAEIIAPSLGLPIIFDDEVQELRFGEADGMTFEGAWAKFGKPDFANHPLRPIAPGGESWGQFTLRVSNALYRIIQEHAGKTIVVVCHGGVIDTSFLYFFQKPSTVLPVVEFSTRNTAITHWEQRNRDGLIRWRLVKYNDTAHLNDIGVKESVRWEDVRKETDAESNHLSAPLPTEE
ncbi:MAG: histidine phosphatase family protein [Chloroflexales bacterium]|nr:histidine phosphatase family protein [Chloroflexales bacterium]